MFLSFVAKLPCAGLKTWLPHIPRYNTGAAGKGGQQMHPYSSRERANVSYRGLQNAGCHVTVEGHCTEL